MVFFSLGRWSKKHSFPVDQRFPPTDEAEFKASLEEDVVRYGSITAVIAASIGTFGWTIGSGNGPLGFTKLSGSGMIVFLVWAACNMINLLVSALAFARLKRRYFLNWNWELIVVTLLIMNILVEACFNLWYGPLLLGEQPEDVWQKDMRATHPDIALSLDVIITASCLFIPIRVCILWIVGSFGVLAFFCMAFFLRGPFPESGQGSLALLTGLAVMSFLGACRNERLARKEWSSSQRVVEQEKELVNRHAALSRILHRFCDSVVHLGPSPDFPILGPNPRLASMLLFTDGRTLEGKSICTFLASEEDKTRMVNALQDEGDIIQSVDLNIHLRDANGREFAVTACFSCFHDFGDAPQFVVGIVEPQERTFPSYSSAVEDENTFRPYAKEARPDICSMSSTDTSSLAACVEVAKHIPCFCDSQNYLFPDEAAVVWVDPWTPDLVIVQCNSRFSAIGGLSSTSKPLDSWIRVKQKGQRLSTLVDGAVNDIVFGHSLDSHLKLDLGLVSIRPPGFGLLEYIANCSIYCEHVEDVDEAGVVDGVKLQFIFTNIKTRSTKPYVKKKRGTPPRSTRLESNDSLRKQTISLSL